MLTIDRREIQEHEDIPELIGVPFTVETLDSGDYCFLTRRSEVLGIERSEINNLMQKLWSGELEAQLVRCSEQYNSVMLLVEGVYDEVAGYLAVYKQTDKGYYRNRICPNTKYADIMAVLSRLSELGIEVIQTPNFAASMTCIRTIYGQRNKPEDEHSLFKRTRAIQIPTKLTNNPAVPKLMALCPRLGEKVAIRLINKYNTIWEIIHAEDAELLNVEGMGKGLLQNLKKGLGKP